MDKILKCKDCGEKTVCSDDSKSVICSDCVTNRIVSVNTNPSNTRSGDAE